MRALLAIAFMASSALADPAPGVGSGTGSGAAVAIVAPEPWQPYRPADHGGFSGIVIVPEPIQDDLPYPRGMVIEPPDTGDRMANVLARPWTWSTRSLWQRLADGAGAIWNALVPRHL